MSILRICFTLMVILLAGFLSKQGRAQEIFVLEGKAGVEAHFEVTGSNCKWIAYRDVVSEQRWDISGPYFSLQTTKGETIDQNQSGLTRVTKNLAALTLERDISSLPLTVKQIYSFCKDGRTLRIQTSLRSRAKTIEIKQIGLLDIIVPGEKLRLTGPDYISFPIFGERIFAGIEHPSAACRVQDDSLQISQPLHRLIGTDWIDLSAAVFGSASDQDFALEVKEGPRKAFIRYLDGVRIQPSDMHIHYNDWWTAPQPSSETFVLSNINDLKKNLFDETGFFFDSYALDEGWADRHSVWEINYEDFPDGFRQIRQMLNRVGSRPGLWISPSGLYPNSLDNHWLASQGYEVTPNERLGLNPCLALGGKYQTTFKKNILNHVRENKLAHVKFDGFVPFCDVSTHGHPTGVESYLPIAEGLMEVFDSLRTIDENIALEPTCFGYQASPWWLMHVPFIIGPFGDDSPKGRCPSPEWIEAMTTARDIRNLQGRDAFLMPGSALQCFDIVVQSPGAFQNHAVMAVGRGRWFMSCYINPDFMNKEEWQFFADLMIWARHNRDYIKEPIPIGGDPEAREAYGYAFRSESKELYCIRNPWMEETTLPLPGSLLSPSPREIRLLYPRRKILARIEANEPVPPVHLGPYETQYLEIITTDQPPVSDKGAHKSETGVSVTWTPEYTPFVQPVVVESEGGPFGPSWSCPYGETNEIRIFKLEGALEVKGAAKSDLYILCEGQSIQSAFPQIELLIDGEKISCATSRSVGEFSAGGYTDEDWIWFSTPLPTGTHHLDLEIKAFTKSADFGVFLCGAVDAPPSLPPFESGPVFPLFQEDSITWSYTIASETGKEIEVRTPCSITRSIEKIDGVYLDMIDWIDASVGWRKIQINHSVKGQTMTMGGQMFHRGIGTHAYSRIRYKRPENYDTFAATIGCDQKALVGSVVFVIEGDGIELFRSPVLKATSIPLDIEIPLRGLNEISLILEDGGDRINADHGNWANARFLK